MLLRRALKGVLASEHPNLLGFLFYGRKLCEAKSTNFTPDKFLIVKNHGFDSNKYILREGCMQQGGSWWIRGVGGGGGEQLTAEDKLSFLNPMSLQT